MHSISSNSVLLSVLPVTSSLLSKCKSKETFQITSVLTQNSLSLETVMECFVYGGELLKSGLGMGSLQCTDNFCNKPRTFCLRNVIRCLLYSVHTVWISIRDVLRRQSVQICTCYFVLQLQSRAIPTSCFFSGSFLLSVPFMGRDPFTFLFDPHKKGSSEPLSSTDWTYNTFSPLKVHDKS